MANLAIVANLVANFTIGANLMATLAIVANLVANLLHVASLVPTLVHVTNLEANLAIVASLWEKTPRLIKFYIGFVNIYIRQRSYRDNFLLKFWLRHFKSDFGYSKRKRKVESVSSSSS